MPTLRLHLREHPRTQHPCSPPRGVAAQRALHRMCCTSPPPAPTVPVQWALGKYLWKWRGKYFGAHWTSPFRNSKHFYLLSFGHSKTRTQIPSGLVRMFTKIQLINSFLFILWPKYAENLYGFHDCCPLRQNLNTAKPSLSFPPHCSETESSPTLDAANLRQSLPNAICLCGWVRCCTAWEYWFVPASLGGQSRVVGVCWHKGSHCGAVCVSDTYVAQRARHRHSYPQNPTTMLICHLDAYFYPTSVSTAVIDKGAGGAFEKYQASAF